MLRVRVGGRVGREGRWFGNKFERKRRRKKRRKKEIKLEELKVGKKKTERERAIGVGRRGMDRENKGEEG